MDVKQWPLYMKVQSIPVKWGRFCSTELIGRKSESMQWLFLILPRHINWLPLHLWNKAKFDTSTLPVSANLYPGSRKWRTGVSYELSQGVNSCGLREGRVNWIVKGNLISSHMLGHMHGSYCINEVMGSGFVWYSSQIIWMAWLIYHEVCVLCRILNSTFVKPIMLFCIFSSPWPI